MIRNFIFVHKLYRDIWLIATTVLIVLALGSIQDSRHDTLVRACVDTNQRHDLTVERLDQIISRIEDPAQKRRALQSKSNTVFLIEALAPYTEDCEARADKLLGR